MLKKWFFIFIITVSSMPAWSQNQASGNSPSALTKYGPRRQIATIVYMGLGGAVLGLSTLSFYGRPQDKLTNIPIGFGVGVIVGTIYMTYQAATNPQDFYRTGEYHPQWNQNKEFELTTATDVLVPQEQPTLSYAWSF